MLYFVSLFCSFVRMFARIECEENALCVVAATWKLRHCEIALVKKIIMIVDYTASVSATCYSPKHLTVFTFTIHAYALQRILIANQPCTDMFTATQQNYTQEVRRTNKIYIYFYVLYAQHQYSGASGTLHSSIKHTRVTAIIELSHTCCPVFQHNRLLLPKINVDEKYIPSLLCNLATRLLRVPIL
jgi:hypothetical protein